MVLGPKFYETHMLIRGNVASDRTPALWTLLFESGGRSTMGGLLCCENIRRIFVGDVHLSVGFSRSGQWFDHADMSSGGFT